MNQPLDRGDNRPEPPAVAFLVRCWREGEQWRFLLENVTTRERQGFDQIESLMQAILNSLVDTTDE